MSGGLKERCLPQVLAPWVTGQWLVMFGGLGETVLLEELSLEVGFESLKPRPTSSLLSLLHAGGQSRELCHLLPFCPCQPQTMLPSAGLVMVFPHGNRKVTKMEGFKMELGCLD